MLRDFQKFLEQRFARDHPEIRRGIGLTVGQDAVGVQEFFKTMSLAAETLEDIDEQENLKGQYSFERRVPVAELRLACSAAFVTGIVVPLLALAGGWKSSAGFRLTLLVLAVGATGTAYILFLRDVRVPPRLSYLSLRWYAPIASQVEANITKVGRSGVVDLSIVSEAAHSPDAQYFDEPIKGGLLAYLEASQQYNKQTVETTAQLVGIVKARLPIDATAPSSNGCMTARASEFSDASAAQRILARRPHGLGICIETEMSWWSRTALRVQGDWLDRNERLAAAAFQEATEKLSRDGLTRQLGDSRVAVGRIGVRLEDDLRRAAGPAGAEF
jgi:hypothetical protein